MCHLVIRTQFIPVKLIKHKKEMRKHEEIVEII